MQATILLAREARRHKLVLVEEGVAPDPAVERERYMRYATAMLEAQAAAGQPLNGAP
jgi:hypothetical protein